MIEEKENISMLDLSIIIISYNTREMTLACLQSVYLQTTDISFEVLVVDNDSKDDSARVIAKNFPDVKMIASQENLGFARANNLAAKTARGEYLLLLNPDTVVLDGAIQKLLVFARRHPENRIYGGRTLFDDLSLNPTSCWRRPSIWSLFCYAIGLVSLFRRNVLFDPESYGVWQRDSVRQVDIVTGCFLMIEKKFWSQLSGFDSQFFMYGEDADLCLRATKEGAAPIITPEATIIHYCGASEKVRSDKMVRIFHAKEQMIRVHWNPLAARIGLSLIRLSVFSRMAACYFLNIITSKKKLDRANDWKAIWERRDEWRT